MSATEQRMSAAEYRALRAPPAKRNKFNAKRTDAGFDSLGEEQRFRDLELLERIGRIHDLKRQARVELSVGGTPLYHEDSKRRVTYTADSSYIEDGILTLEDFKGCDTRESRLKRQIVRAMGYRLRVTRSAKGTARAAQKHLFKSKATRSLAKPNPQGRRPPARLRNSADEI